jgi:hypothetical protein
MGVRQLRQRDRQVPELAGCRNVVGNDTEKSLLCYKSIYPAPLQRKRAACANFCLLCLLFVLRSCDIIPAFLRIALPDQTA